MGGGGKYGVGGVGVACACREGRGVQGWHVRGGACGTRQGGVWGREAWGYMHT